MSYEMRKGDAVLIARLAAGATVRDAADAAGIAERTAYRRLELVDFRREVSATRRRFLAEVVGKLADAGTEAADTLRDLLSARSENVRHASARSIIELSQRLSESVELEERVAELEARIEAQTTGGQRWHA